MSFIFGVFWSFFSNSSYSDVHNMTVSLSGEHGLQIIQNGKRRLYNFNVEINGYETSCDGSKIILWGYPLRFNENSPADNSYVLYDVVTNSVTYDGLMAHGIFDAGFLKDNKRAFLGSGEMYFIYLSTGELSRVDNTIIAHMDSLFEKCRKPINWSYNKFPAER
jgi:hypothetical protein